jgi:outer membrane protein assembly factor BamB
MLRRLGVALMLVLSLVALAAWPAAAVPGHRDWLTRYTPGASPDARAIAVSGDGARVFVAGFAQRQHLTLAYDALTGAEVWTGRYGVTGSPAFASDLVVSRDDSVVFVTGSVFGAHWWDYATVAYDAATGAQLWASTFDGPAGDTDLATSIAVNFDGTVVFVTGSTTVDASVFGGQDYATIAYDATTGAELWSKRYNGPSDDSDAATDLALSPDDAFVFVTGGSCCGVDSVSEFATIAYDASTGDRLWARRYDGPDGGYFHDGRTLEVSPDGSLVFVTGGSCRPDSCRENYATVAYDAASGEKIWDRIHAGPADGSRVPGSVVLCVSQDGKRVSVAGVTGKDGFAVTYRASTGATTWNRRYDGPRRRIDEFTGVVSRGLAVFVTGWSQSDAGDRDYVTIAYDGQTGDGLWLRRYDGGSGNDAASAVTATLDGSGVFVTGTSEAPAFRDIVTIRYAAT